MSQEFPLDFLRHAFSLFTAARVSLIVIAAAYHRSRASQ
jgi:hypothetical protein